MPNKPGKFLTLLSIAVLAAGLAAPVAGKDQEEEEKIEAKAPKPSREVKKAQQIHGMVLATMGVHDDLELKEYIQRVGEKVAKHSSRPELDWKFTIVDTDDVNAFATMGGFVYISRGILPYMRDEAELAAVLGHEVAHVAAKHSQAKQRKSVVAGIASAATAIFTGMPQLAQLTDMAGAAIVSGYGREAELEADRLGAEYLAKAGYNPDAMIGVIATLKDQDTFERDRARIEKRQPRIYHGVFASHPDNDTRLREAVAAAGTSSMLATGEDNSNAAGFLQAIEGLPVGSSRRQGMLRENRFYHADLQFTLAFPRGWEILNGPDQILAVAPNREHVMELRTQVPPSDLTDPRDFVLRGLGDRRLERAESLEINGLKTYTMIVRNDPSPYGQSTNVRYVVIYFGNAMWVFKGASRSGDGLAPAGDALFLSTANTFRRLRADEYQLAEPHRLRVVKATEGMTFEELAKDSVIKQYPEQQLRLYNQAYPKGEPTPGETVKVVE